MRARKFWWLLPVLVLGLAACGDDDEVVDPGSSGSPAVVWILSGDRSGEASGDHAVLHLHVAGSESYVDLDLQVYGGHSLRIYSPSGETGVTKTVYEVKESQSDDWHARLRLMDGEESVRLAAVDGFLTVEELSPQRVSGFFSLDTQQLDEDDELMPDGLEVHVQGNFSAVIQRSIPETRAVMKGKPTCWPIAVLGVSR